MIATKTRIRSKDAASPQSRTMTIETDTASDQTREPPARTTRRDFLRESGLLTPLTMLGSDHDALSGTKTAVTDRDHEEQFG